MVCYVGIKWLSAHNLKHELNNRMCNILIYVKIRLSVGCFLEYVFCTLMNVCVLSTRARPFLVSFNVLVSSFYFFYVVSLSLSPVKSTS